MVEYTTVKNNIYWINGIILNGVGARANERGNVIFGNKRVNYRKEMGEQMGHENEGKWHVNESGRVSLDSLINVITENVKKMVDGLMVVI